MASSTINGTTSNAYIISKIEWSSTPSNANNNSSVTASLYYRRTNTWTGTATSGTGSFSITIDGQSGSNSLSFTVPNDNSWVKALTVTKTVKHNNDGKKIIVISASGSISGSSLTYTTCSGNATLDDIPRQATITSATDFNDEGNPSFTFSNPANASLSCWLEPNPIGDHLCERTLRGASGTFTWSLTEDERKQLRKACSGNSCTCRIGLYSTIDNTQYASYQDVTMSIVNGNPIFTASQISYADTSAAKNVTENPQHIVQNQSNLAVTFTSATAKKEATISKYEITVNGTMKTTTASGTVDFGKINSSSNVEINIKVIDSRGNTATAKKTVTVLPWSKPLWVVSLWRKNNYEDETYLKVAAGYSSIDGKNIVTASYKYKEIGGEYGEPVEIENKTQYTLTCDKNKAYIFSVTIADAFDSVTDEIELSKGKFPLFIDTQKSAVGINEFPTEDEALRVAGGMAHFEDGVKIGGNALADYIIEQGTSGIWTYEKWASGKAVCWGVTNAEEFDLIDEYESVYYSEPTKNGKMGKAVFPENLFFAAPTKVHIQNYATLGLISCHIRDVSMTEVNFYVSNPASITMSLRFTIEAKGRWKS